VDEKSRKIPTEKQWGDYRSSLDADYAHRMFAGKTIEEVLPYIETSPLDASECLSYMLEAPFQFYIFAFEKFLMSERAFSDPLCDSSDGASTFLRLVKNKLAYSPEVIIPVMARLMPVVEFVASHQGDYGASEDIYGSFAALATDIEALYQAALVHKRD
jgi:hypothetical protein